MPSSFCLPDYGLAASAFHMGSCFGNFDEPVPPFALPTEPDFESVSSEPLRPAALDRPFWQLLQERFSRRTFRAAPLARPDLDAVLVASYGRVSLAGAEERRTVPSAGGIYPLRLVILVRNVTELAPGIYELMPGPTRLRPLPVLPPEDPAAWFRTRHIDYGGAAATVFVLGAMDRLCAKYGERGYRYLLLEAGHVGQNACLACAARGIDHIPVGGFDDDAVNRALCRPDRAEATLYSIVLGGR